MPPLACPRAVLVDVGCGVPREVGDVSGGVAAEVEVDDVAGDHLGFVEDDVFEEVVGGVAVGAGVGDALVAPVVVAGHVSADAGEGGADDEFEAGELVEVGGRGAEIGVH